MNSVVFIAMLLGLVAGVTSLSLARLCELSEGRRRAVFFAGCMLGFWAASVAMLADGVAQSFSELQDGLESTVHNSLITHWQRSGRNAEIAGLQDTRRLCTSQDLAASPDLHCSVALGVNSTAVCPGWMLYAPFFLPAVQPCAALRTSSELLSDAMARQVLVDALNDPCAYVPGSADYAAKRMRKALGCAGGQPLEQVMLIVDRPGEHKTLVLRPGRVSLP